MIAEARDIIEIIAVIAVPLGTWGVIQWRVGQLEDQRTKDLDFAKEERGRIQAECRSAQDNAWGTIHKLENDLHAHQLEALQERLLIERRFGDSALALANFGGDVKTIKEVVTRLETKVNEIKEEQRS